jgi:hypothetical protein
MTLQDSAEVLKKLPIAQDWGFMSEKMTQVVLVKHVLPNATRGYRIIADVIDEDVQVTSKNFYNVERLEKPLSKELSMTLVKGKGIHMQFQIKKGMNKKKKPSHIVSCKVFLNIELFFICII